MLSPSQLSITTFRNTYRPKQRSFTNKPTFNTTTKRLFPPRKRCPTTSIRHEYIIENIFFIKIIICPEVAG
nr:hypothetical protein [Cressdnaviricota sp.]